MSAWCTFLNELLLSYTLHILIFAFCALMVRGIAVGRLRDHHPAEYRALGNPSILGWMNKRSSWAFDKFAFLRRDRGLDDAWLTVVTVGWLPIAVVAYCLWVVCAMAVICSYQS